MTRKLGTLLGVLVLSIAGLSGLQACGSSDSDVDARVPDFLDADPIETPDAAVTIDAGAEPDAALPDAGV